MEVRIVHANIWSYPAKQIHIMCAVVASLLLHLNPTIASIAAVLLARNLILSKNLG